MLRNYLLTAIRVLKKNPLFSFINILGLAIGLAVSSITYLWVYNELSFDEFHKDAHRIFRPYACYFFLNPSFYDPAVGGA